MEKYIGLLLLWFVSFPLQKLKLKKLLLLDMGDSDSLPNNEKFTPEISMLRFPAAAVDKVWIKLIHKEYINVVKLSYLNLAAFVAQRLYIYSTNR